MKDVYANAKKLMSPHCRICPSCNGRTCVGKVPGMGGLGSGTSFHNNIKALEQVQFNMRLIHDVIEPDTTVEILGKKLSLPLLAAPIGGVEFNMGGGISEEQYADAIVLGCKAKGIIGCTGDGVPPFIHECGNAAIKKADGDGIPFIKPWEDQEWQEKLTKAKATGTDTIGMDIDAAGLITLRQMGRPVSPKPLAKLKQIVADSGMKFILKGVMTVSDAEMAVEAGVDAIIVSNHGGRVLDYAPGSAEVLPTIAAKVKGRITILADGGVRSGGDILKLLALGADAVLIGRPFSVVAVGGLQEGVEKYIDMIHSQLKQCMVLTGTATADNVTADIVYGR